MTTDLLLVLLLAAAILMFAINKPRVDAEALSQSELTLVGMRRRCGALEPHHRNSNCSAPPYWRLAWKNCAL